MPYKTIIQSIVTCATFVFFEVLLPFGGHTAQAQIAYASDALHARRDMMSVRLATTPVPKRDICELRYCGPIITVTKSVKMLVTAYSSTPDQTFGDPFITASGSRVHWGTFAVNGVPMGTKLRIPDYYGDSIFTVEDRMNSRYSSYHGDIWMETRAEARQWGARYVTIEFVTVE